MGSYSLIVRVNAEAKHTMCGQGELTDNTPPELPEVQKLNDLERSIFRLGRVLRKVRVGQDETLSYATGAGYWELVLLQRKGPIRATEIAASLALDISTVSRQIKQLESDGLLSKQPDVNDARATLISLTTRGNEVISELTALRERLIQASLSAWSSEDKAEFEKLLNRFVEDLEAASET